MTCSFPSGHFSAGLSCNFTSLITFDDDGSPLFPPVLQREPMTRSDDGTIILGFLGVQIKDEWAYSTAVTGTTQIQRISILYWTYSFIISAAAQHSGSILGLGQKYSGSTRVSPVLYFSDALAVVIHWLLLVGFERVSPRFAASLILKQRFIDDNGETDVKSLQAIQDQRKLRWISFVLGILPPFLIMCGTQGIVPVQIVGFSYIISWIIFELLFLVFTFEAPISWYSPNQTFFPRLKRWRIAKWYALLSVLTAAIISSVPVAVLLGPFLTIPLQPYPHKNLLLSAIAFCSGVYLFASLFFGTLAMHLMVFQKNLEPLCEPWLDSVLKMWKRPTILNFALTLLQAITALLLALPQIRSQVGLDPLNSILLLNLRLDVAAGGVAILLVRFNRALWRWQWIEYFESPTRAFLPLLWHLVWGLYVNHIYYVNDSALPSWHGFFD